MALTPVLMSAIFISFGLISFILGILAENKKPLAGKGVVICNYHYNSTVALGYLSFLFLVASTLVGYFSLFYPYNGKPIPRSILFEKTSFLVFFNIALFTTGLGAALTLWPTIDRQRYLGTNKVYYMSVAKCPTVITGLFGGAAFLSLDSSLFWLVTLMFAVNTREDYFDDEEVDENYVQNHQFKVIGIYNGRGIVRAPAPAAIIFF
ncbi:hypothetical protein UlMin_034503 [Ulmus minor]